MALRRFVPLAVFLAVAAAGLLASGFTWVAAEDARRVRFEATADDAVSRIQARIDQHMALLNATQGFMMAQDDMPSGEAFERFIGALDMQNRYAGIRAIGLAGLVRPGEEAGAEADFLSNYGVSRKIWSDGQQASAAPSGWRTAIMRLAPLNERGRASIGYDMFSEPMRREAMLAALESGSARATAPVTLLQWPDLTGFLVYLPLPDPGSQDVTSSIAPDRPVRGFLFAAFRANELFKAALSGFPLLPVAVDVTDNSGGESQLLYRSAAEPVGTIGVDLTASRTLVIAGRSWLFRFKPTAAYPSQNIFAIPCAVGLLGILLAGALALLARGRERQFEAVAALHRAGEKSLLDKDLMLQEMKHRIKNSIARVLAIARQTASGAASIEDFSSSFSARLQAMAASQDMLTRSHWQRADLAELLRTELDQVFGKLAGTVIDGPQTSLDERTTQALGLTFHELATNALKYGDRSAGASNLTVRWSLEGTAGKRRLTLLWHELNAKGGVTPPEKVGFGTRLIDMNIVRELGGEIERIYAADGLRIAITIPLPADTA